MASDVHAGLAKIGQAIDGIDDALVAYSAAASHARTEGLDQVAEVYDSLAGGVHPAQLPPDLGFWVGTYNPSWFRDFLGPELQAKYWAE